MTYEQYKFFTAGEYSISERLRVKGWSEIGFEAQLQDMPSE